MMKCKMIIITLTIICFVVSTGAWKTECFEQLQSNGKFDLTWNKTVAFRHAYYYIVSPRKVQIDTEKGILYAYQHELIQTFLDAHEGHLHDMFDDPKTWCRKNIDILGDKRRKFIPVEPNCIESMKNKYTNLFVESRKLALLNMFFRLKDVKNFYQAKAMQKYYMRYVGPIIENYVVYTSARSPSDFCNGIESPALPLPVDENGYAMYNLHLNVIQTTQFQSNQTAASSNRC